ncbi:hypothetical protein G6L37_04940 [Agrobacterium rubi]|nr:hypothetical protein [Agrobacterium rubi]NTF24701.1 hypothetical protein [Agrobacterium rubi]
MGNEIYVVRERHSRSACGLIGYKREIEYESYGGVACVYASFDLSAIYIAPDYIGTGLATALFHPILSDVQSVIDHSINSVHILKKKCGARLAVSFYLTGEAQSSGGAACASSLQDAMLRAVRLSARNLRKGSSFLMEDPVIDLFDYGDEEMWRDYMIDELRTAA